MKADVCNSLVAGKCVSETIFTGSRVFLATVGVCSVAGGLLQTFASNCPTVPTHRQASDTVWTHGTGGATASSIRAHTSTNTLNTGHLNSFKDQQYIFSSQNTNIL